MSSNIQVSAIVSTLEAKADMSNRTLVFSMLRGKKWKHILVEFMEVRKRKFCHGSIISCWSFYSCVCAGGGIRTFSYAKSRLVDAHSKKFDRNCVKFRFWGIGALVENRIDWHDKPVFPGRHQHEMYAFK